MTSNAPVTVTVTGAAGQIPRGPGPTPPGRRPTGKGGGGRRLRAGGGGGGRARPGYPPGMERGDLLQANGGIFAAGRGDQRRAPPTTCACSSSGNPANTNALIAASHAPDVPAERFTAMTRLDHNRALSQLAKKAGVPVSEISRLTIWGNHSATPVPGHLPCPDLGPSRRTEVVETRRWLENDFIPTVAKRGAAIIEARGASSAASAANAAIDHVYDWVNGTPDGDWTSAAVVSDGSYGVPEGLVSSFPARCSGGRWEIVQGLEIDDFSRARIDASAAELAEERDAVKGLRLA